MRNLYGDIININTNCVRQLFHVLEIANMAMMTNEKIRYC